MLLKFQHGFFDDRLPLDDHIWLLEVLCLHLSHLLKHLHEFLQLKTHYIAKRIKRLLNAIEVSHGVRAFDASK